jgi:putative DNA primase/helicase
MRGNFFPFRPQAKIVVYGNQQPKLVSSDDAWRRRMLFINFSASFTAAPNLGLKEALWAERDGIAAWIIKGAADWYKHGLKPPASVTTATDDYVADQDSVARWIDERCQLDKAVRTSLRALYADWKDWCEETGEYTETRHGFSRALAARFEKDKDRTGSGFRGLKLRGLKLRSR